MNLVKSSGLTLALSLMTISFMDILFLQGLNDISDLMEFYKPITIFIMAFVFVAALVVKKCILQILPMMFFGLLSIHYFMGIIKLAIITDNIIKGMIRKTSKSNSSIFSVPVLPNSVGDAREHMLIFFVVMFMIMFSMTASAYNSMVEKKTSPTLDQQQVVWVVLSD